MYLFSKISILSLQPTHPPNHWLPEALSPQITFPGCEADHSPPFTAKVEDESSYTSTPPLSLRGMYRVYCTLIDDSTS